MQATRHAETRTFHRRGACIAAAIACLLLAGCGERDDAPAPIAFTQVVAVDTPPPAYPRDLACDQVGGKVELTLTVGTDGRPARIQTRQGSGFPALDAAAQDAARSWRFRPATRNGQPIESTIQVPMTFHPPAMQPEECYAPGEDAAGQARRSSTSTSSGASGAVSR